jgi:CheY-like chemotaxis protein
LEQVILNLGVNARDAMPGGGTLTITTREEVVLQPKRADDGSELVPGCYIQLCVSDSGCGMDAQTKAQIFEPFFTTKAPGRGTGLGLATVYGIVKQSGGAISVESEPGRGSTFCIHLPREEGPVEPPRPAAPPVQYARTGETVMVIEDEEVVRDLLCAVLRDAGYQVFCAGSPHEALAVVDEHRGPIHLLVSDVILPEMHGPVIARKVQERHPSMKVLFVSGYSENDISDQGVLDPGIEVLQKPFSQQDLVRKVREMLEATVAV